MTPFISKATFDTHTFLWWNQEPERLSAPVRELLASPDVRLFLSVVVLWELQIKAQAGKLNLRYSLSELSRIEERDSRVKILPVTATHILELDTLPLLHRDPFDRLLLAQAQAEGATLLTIDAAVQAYPVATLW